MFRSLSVLMFNTSEIEANLFGMADDVYNTIEIFKEAARFEAKIGRPYRMISTLMDCLVFMVVALMVVGFIMHDRIVLIRKLARINQRNNDVATLQPIDVMVGTPKWALKWLSTIRNTSFGSIYDGWFR